MIAITGMNNALYEKAAKAAYENSLDLLNEASILYEHGRYARACALTVFSCEEFAKAFLYKCNASGLIIDKKFEKDILKHDIKLAHFTHLIVSVFRMSSFDRQYEKSLKHDKGLKDHSMHILPDVFKKMAKLDVKPMMRLFKLSHDVRLLALYVDIEDNKVIRPNLIDKNACGQFLHIVRKYTAGFASILDEDKERFKLTVEFVDPDILKTGKLKFD